jgi:hypothetical protein
MDEKSTSGPFGSTQEPSGPGSGRPVQFFSSSTVSFSGSNNVCICCSTASTTTRATAVCFYANDM